VTRHPTSAWVIQQLREAFPYDFAPGYLIFDRGSNFNAEVVDTIKFFGIRPERTSFRSPWQNGVAERWVGTNILPGLANAPNLHIADLTPAAWAAKTSSMHLV